MSGDPELAMHRLIDSAVNDSERFAVLLDRLGCPPGSLRGQVLAELVYTVAGWVQDADGTDEPDDATLPCTCEGSVPAEAKAIRIALAYKAMDGSDDGATLSSALVDAARCPAHVLDVLAAQAGAQVGMLDGTGHDWRPTLERELLALLDEN